MSKNKSRERSNESCSYSPDWEFASESYRSSPDWAERNEIDIPTYALAKDDHEVGFTPSATVCKPSWEENPSELHETHNGLVLVRQTIPRRADIETGEIDHHKARSLYKKLLGEGYKEVEPNIALLKTKGQL